MRKMIQKLKKQKNIKKKMKSIFISIALIYGLIIPGIEI